MANEPMNLAGTGKVETMDSREIAELTGKEHRNVYRDIEATLGKLPGGVLSFEHTYVNPQNGQTYRHFLLPYRETMILISGYSVELRARVIDRWMELEHEKALAVPKTLPEALRLAADIEEKRAALEVKLIEAAPKIESFEALMASDTCMSITEASKHFGLHAKLIVFPFLRERCYLTKFNLPTQKAIDADFLTLRQCKGTDGELHSQAVVRRCQLENWRSKVVPQVKEWSKV